MKEQCANCRFWKPIDPPRNFIGQCNLPGTRKTGATDRLETCEDHQPATSEIEDYLA